MDEWQKRAEKLYFEDHKGLSEISTELGRTYNSVRGYIRNHPKYRAGNKPPEGRPTKAEKKAVVQAETPLLKMLEKPHTLEELSDKTGLSQRVILAQIADYQDGGYNIEEAEGSYCIKKITNQAENVYNNDWRGEKQITFALVSDSHLCSKSCQITHLHDFYDRCVEYGIKDVFHAGDWVDGCGVYSGQEYGVHTIGMDEQKDFFVKNYPARIGITTHGIGGNHDLKTFSKTGNDICKAIAQERPDIDYLGQYFARVNLTPKCILQLCHPLGNQAYSTTYRLQRKMDGMTGNDKPGIMGEGHFHSGAYLFRRNIHGIMLPSFQGHNDLSRRLGLESNIGGVICTVKLETDGTIKEFTPKFINYMKLIEDDYKNYT